jgi:hypothetical protein
VRALKVTECDWPHGERVENALTVPRCKKPMLTPRGDVAKWHFVDGAQVHEYYSVLRG